MTSATGSPAPARTSACVRSRRHHRTVRRSLRRLECGKTHTLDLFRHAEPDSGARFIAASRRSPLTMLAANYAVLSNDRVRDHHDRAGQRARSTDAAAHLRGRAGPADGSHQTRAELAASASGAARMAGGRPPGPALLRV